MAISAATAAKLQGMAKVLTNGAKSIGLASGFGAIALLFMVWRDTTPEGQKNVQARQETARQMSSDDVQRERIKLEREKFEAAQAVKGN
jgi:hypothetical protein